MMSRFQTFFKSTAPLRILAFLGLGILVGVESGCRVQAGNPQTSKPVKPGTVTIALADAPVDELSQVLVRVYGVAFAPQGAGRCLREPQRACADSSLFFYELNKEVEIDLLSLSDGKTEVLPFSQSLPSGTYEGIRLFLSDTATVDGVLKSTGQRIPLAFPNSPFGRREFTILEEFDVQEDTNTEIIIHVDLRRSIQRRPDGGYFMLPFTSVVPRHLAARIYGGVAETSSPVERVCAYNVGGRRQPGLLPPQKQPSPTSVPQQPFTTLGAPQPLPSSLMKAPAPAHHSPLMQPPLGPTPFHNSGTPQHAVRPPTGQPDSTQSCDNADAVSDVKDGRFDLRYLPPVPYLLRVFKKDGTFTDTRVPAPLRPQEEREVNL